MIHAPVKYDEVCACTCRINNNGAHVNFSSLYSRLSARMSTWWNMYWTKPVSLHTDVHWGSLPGRYIH